MKTELTELDELGYKTIKSLVNNTTKRTLVLKSCFLDDVLSEFEGFFSHLGSSDERYEKQALAKAWVTDEQINEWIMRLVKEPNFNIDIQLPNGYKHFKSIPNKISCKTLTVKSAWACGHVEYKWMIKL
jgi:hypothetical protein